MNDDGYTLVRIPGSDAIYRLPAGCPVTDENLRRFGERVSPPSGDVVSDPTDLVTCASATRPAMPTPDTIVREVDTGRAARWTGSEWVDDLWAWLEWAIEDDERVALAARGRLLREAESKRRILAIHRRRADVFAESGGTFANCCDGCGYGGYCDDPTTEDINECPILRAMVLPYAERAGRREEWAP